MLPFETSTFILVGWFLKTTQTIIKLENNIFKFNSELYRQDVGAAMGCKPIPGNANMFMAAEMTKGRNEAERRNANSQKILQTHPKSKMSKHSTIYQTTSS